jgi:hypothetical protein
MLTRTFVYFTLLISFISTNLFAKTDSEIRAAITNVTHQRILRVKPDFWQSLGTNAPKVIIEMYKETGSNFQHIRMLEGLAFYSDPQATAFLKTQASTTSNNVVRQLAIRSVGRSTAASKEKAFFVGFLKHPDPQTRVEAAVALLQTKDASAVQQVKTFIASENTPWVVERVKNVADPEPSPDPDLVHRNVPLRD